MGVAIVALAILALTVPILSSAVPSIGRTDDKEQIYLPTSYNERAANTTSQGRLVRAVGISHSNMPVAWQVEAAKISGEAFAFQTTDSGRLTEISELFSDSHPFWYWNVALNWRYLFDRYSQYYLHLTVDDDHIYLFSTV